MTSYKSPYLSEMSLNTNNHSIRKRTYRLPLMRTKPLADHSSIFCQLSKHLSHLNTDWSFKSIYHREEIKLSVWLDKPIETCFVAIKDISADSSGSVCTDSPLCFVKHGEGWLWVTFWSLCSISQIINLRVHFTMCKLSSISDPLLLD